MNENDENLEIAPTPPLPPEKEESALRWAFHLGLFMVAAAIFGAVVKSFLGNAFILPPFLFATALFLGYALARSGALGARAAYAIICLGLIASSLLFVREIKKSPFVVKSNEGATKGKLVAIRDALTRYRAANDTFPSELDSLITESLPQNSVVKTPFYHEDSASVYYGEGASDIGGWFYNNVPGHSEFGTVSVNCTHTDAQGSVWVSY
ncbi:MAG: hypothetical protein COB53_08175 [Elusimicrobia bacterium]|nr:MAG: hypothetical protein COB53_08175 [Elusimicrobiota bacterium]